MRLRGAAVAAVVLFSGEARADCAMPSEYEVTEGPAGTVRIQAQNTAGRKCPDDGLLRRDAATGAIVEITTCAGDDFLDECVPAGTYQYGLARPYDCVPAACGTWYFAEQAIAGAALPCTRGIPDPAAATSVPWTSDHPMVCSHRGRDDGGGCGTAPLSVLGTNFALLLVGVAGWRWRPGSRKEA
jgi:hypothetical protein